MTMHLFPWKQMRPVFAPQERKKESHEHESCSWLMCIVSMTHSCVMCASCDTYIGAVCKAAYVMWMRRITYAWVMSHLYKSRHKWMSHFTNQSVISHVSLALSARLSRSGERMMYVYNRIQIYFHTTWIYMRIIYPCPYLIYASLWKHIYLCVLQGSRGALSRLASNVAVFGAYCFEIFWDVKFEVA